MTNKNEECKGCNQYDICNMPVKYSYDNKTYICPCQKCLLKGICKDDCPEYETFIQIYYKKHNQELNQAELIKKYKIKNDSDSSHLSYVFNRYNRGIPIMVKFNNMDKKWELIPFILQTMTLDSTLDISYKECIMDLLYMV